MVQEDKEHENGKHGDREQEDREQKGRQQEHNESEWSKISGNSHWQRITSLLEQNRVRRDVTKYLPQTCKCFTVKAAVKITVGS